MTSRTPADDDLAWRPPGLDDALPTPSPALDALRAKIGADLQARQGPDRARSPWSRFWPFLGAAAVGLGALPVLSPARSGTGLLPVGLAGLAAGLSLVAAAVAPRRPARAERIGQLGIAVAAGAVVAELLHATPGREAPLGAHAGCAGTTLATALVPAGLVGFALVRSGLPARWFHVAPAAAAAVALAVTAVWRHCPWVDPVHVGIAHAALPAAFVAAGAVVLRRLTRPQPLPV